MKKLFLVILLALPAVALGGLILMARASAEAVEVGLTADGAGLMPCPPSPNCVCSEPGAESAEAAIEPLVFACEPELAWASLMDFLAAETRARVVTADERYVHAAYWTPYLKFVDDVEFRLAPDEGVVHVRSASRIGYSDLGTNRERIEWIRSRWIPPAAYGSDLHDGYASDEDDEVDAEDAGVERD